MIANGAELSEVVLANEADEANGAGGTNAKERETVAASRTRLLETFIFLFSYKLKSITSVSVLLVEAILLHRKRQEKRHQLLETVS